MAPVRHAFAVLAVAGSIAAAQAPVPAPSEEPPVVERRDPRDDALATAVGDELAGDPRVSAMKIKVAARDGIVTLTGTANDADAKDAADAVARGVTGVRDVENRLVVREPGAPAPGTSIIPEVPAPR